MSVMRGEEQGSKSPFSLLSEPISLSSLLFEPISPSSLNVYLTFSPSSLLFPPSSQRFLGHFSLLPILFFPFCNAGAVHTFPILWHNEIHGSSQKTSQSVTKCPVLHHCKTVTNLSRIRAKGTLCDVYHKES